MFDTMETSHTCQGSGAGGSRPRYVKNCSQLAREKILSPWRLSRKHWLKHWLQVIPSQPICENFLCPTGCQGSATCRTTCQEWLAAWLTASSQPSQPPHDQLLFRQFHWSSDCCKPQKALCDQGIIFSWNQELRLNLLTPLDPSHYIYLFS